MRVRGILPFFVAFVFASLLIVGQVQTVHAAGTKILYLNYNVDEDQLHIHSVDSDGTNDSALTDGAVADGQFGLAWSPDLSKIAFGRISGDGYDVVVMDADGSNQVTITDDHVSGVYNVSWSPDGTKIAFTSLVEGGPNIYSVNADGTDLTQLTATDTDACAEWASNDDIYFVSFRDGNSEIYSMDADGSNPTNITDIAGTDGIIASFCTLDVSPDASKIAFSSTRQGAGLYEMYIMDTDGSNPTRVTESDANTRNLSPSWSNDSSKIAFVSNEANPNAAPYQVFTANADGTDLTALTDTTENGLFGTQALAPSWSPDDSQIAFSSDRNDPGNTMEVFVMNADGSDPELLVEGIAFMPVWQPAAQDEDEDETDLNGDDVPDSDQPNIGGYVSPITGKIVAIDAGDGCELTTDDITRESNLDVQDPDYSYPNGLFDFAGDCGDPGFSAAVLFYYYDVEPEDFILRKFNPNTNEYFTIDDAEISETTIDGHNVTIVSYTMTDGGELDMDGAVDGQYTDPAGLASSSETLADTGTNQQAYSYGVLMLLMLSGTTLSLARRNTAQKH